MGTARFASPPEFRPVWWAPNGHLQTILPFFFTTPQPLPASVQHTVTLDDGDQIVLHEDDPPGREPSQPTVILVHGLSGSHASSYMVRIARRLYESGNRVWRMDMRGCGAGLHLAKGVFHADRKGDLLAAVRYVVEVVGQSPVLIAGFSLGGNLLLKMLGASPDCVPPQVKAAIAVSPPIDLGYCCRKLSQGWGKLYDKYFARMLWREFNQRRESLRHSNRVTVRKPPRTLFQFDSRVTAPLGGFETVGDYYRSASSQFDLANIEVPTAIVTANDDPIVPVSIYEQTAFSDCLQLFLISGGGHLGYLGHGLGGRDNRWIDRRIVEWVNEQDSSI